jgi:putative acetyltransferase
MAIEIREGGLDDPRVIQLLAFHISMARAQTEPGSAHALDLSGLRSLDIRFWTAWDGGSLLGTAAMKRLSPSHGEIKSMHTAEAFRRIGVGSALLGHLIEEAQAAGIRRLSLETGSWAFFLPARKLYARHGFVECGPFGNYVLDSNSVFMSLELG